MVQSPVRIRVESYAQVSASLISPVCEIQPPGGFHWTQPQSVTGSLTTNGDGLEASTLAGDAPFDWDLFKRNLMIMDKEAYDWFYNKNNGQVASRYAGFYRPWRSDVRWDWEGNENKITIRDDWDEIEAAKKVSNEIRNGYWSSYFQTRNIGDPAHPNAGEEWLVWYRKQMAKVALQGYEVLEGFYSLQFQGVDWVLTVRDLADSEFQIVDVMSLARLLPLVKNSKIIIKDQSGKELFQKNANEIGKELVKIAKDGTTEASNITQAERKAVEAQRRVGLRTVKASEARFTPVRPMTGGRLNPAATVRYQRAMGEHFNELVRAYPGPNRPPNLNDPANADIVSRISQLRQFSNRPGMGEVAAAEIQLLKSGKLSVNAPSPLIVSETSILYYLDRQGTPIAQYTAQEIRARRMTLDLHNDLTLSDGTAAIGLYLGGGRTQVATTQTQGGVRYQRDTLSVLGTVMHEARHHFDNRPNTRWQEFRAFQWEQEGVRWTDELMSSRYGGRVDEKGIWHFLNNESNHYKKLDLGKELPFGP